ncbi:MAG: beta strand repeat-containing protein [Terriglobales bacterium]
MSPTLGGLAKSSRWTCVVVLLLACVLPCALWAQATPPAPNQIAQEVARLPLSFEENRGQTDGRVKFLARSGGAVVYLTPNEAVLGLSYAGNVKFNPADPKTLPRVQLETLRVRLLGANTGATIEGQHKLPAVVNYFVGKAARTGIPTFAEVRYRDVYPGIDLVYYGKESRLEHDFVVAPGADPSAIRMAIGGAQQLKLEGGDLVMRTRHGAVRFHKPLVYQEVDGARQMRDGGFVLKGNQVTFAVGAYDRGRALIIDPVIDYLTYVGATSQDVFMTGIATDTANNAYITGSTLATAFPGPGTAATTKQAFVAKFGPKGQLLAQSFLGGNGDTAGNAIAVADGVYIAGSSLATNLSATANAPQTTNAGGKDAFVAVLGTDLASVTYLTYLGGDADDVANGVAVYAPHKAAVVGSTSSPTAATAFPTYPTPYVKGADTNGFAAVVDTSIIGNVNIACVDATHAQMAFATDPQFLGTGQEQIVLSGVTPSGTTVFDGVHTISSVAGNIVTIDIACTVGDGGTGGTLTGNLYYSGVVTRPSPQNTNFNAVAVQSVTGPPINRLLYVAGTTMASSVWGDPELEIIDPLVGPAATVFVGNDSGVGLAVAVTTNDVIIGGATKATSAFGCTGVAAPGCTPQVANGGDWDGFAANFQRDAVTGALGPQRWFSWLGGTGTDTVNAVLDIAGSVVAGGTSSTGTWLDVTHGMPFKGTQDGFIATIHADGSAGQNTFLGGTGYQAPGGPPPPPVDLDGIWALAQDATGAFYAGGQTTSSGLPVTAPAFQEEAPTAANTSGFIAKIGTVGASTGDLTVTLTKSVDPTQNYQHSGTGLFAYDTALHTIVHYTFDLSAGTADGTGVVFNWRAPRNASNLPLLTVLGATPATDCDSSADLVTCRIANLAVGTPVTVDVKTETLSTAQATTAPIDITANYDIGARNKDVVSGFDTAQSVPVIDMTIAAADVTASPSPFKVDVDTSLGIAAVVHNGSAYTAPKAEVVLTVPTGVNAASAASTDCATLSVSGPDITCSLNSVAPNATTVVITGLVPPALPANTPQQDLNGGSVTINPYTGTYVDPASTNNVGIAYSFPAAMRREAALAVTVNAPVDAADVTLTKIHPNQTVYFPVAITNGAGESTLGTVRLTIDAPAFTSLAGPAGTSCTTSGTTITCTDPNPLAGGGTWNIKISGVATGAVGSSKQTFTVTADVDTGSPFTAVDSTGAAATAHFVYDPGNTLVIERESDLGITAPAPQTVDLEADTTYLIEASNYGPDDATAVTVNTSSFVTGNTEFVVTSASAVVVITGTSTEDATVPVSCQSGANLGAGCTANLLPVNRTIKYTIVGHFLANSTAVPATASTSAEKVYSVSISSPEVTLPTSGGHSTTADARTTVERRSNLSLAALTGPATPQALANTLAYQVSVGSSASYSIPSVHVVLPFTTADTINDPLPSLAPLTAGVTCGAATRTDPQNIKYDCVFATLPASGTNLSVQIVPAAQPNADPTNRILLASIENGTVASAGFAIGSAPANLAAVSGPVTAASNNAADDTTAPIATTLRRTANLAMSAVTAPATNTLSADITYQYTVQNAGPDVAKSVDVSLTLAYGAVTGPDSRAAVIKAVSAAGFACPALPITANTVTCTMTSLPAGAGNAVQFTSTVTPPETDLQAGGALTDTLTATAATTSTLVFDDPTTNNSSEATTTLQRTANLDIATGTFTQATPNGDPTFVSLAGPMTYTYHVTNTGPDRAVNANGQLQLQYGTTTGPDGREFALAGTPDACSVKVDGVLVSAVCNADTTNRRVNTPVPTLAAGKTAEIIVKITPPVTDATKPLAPARQAMVNPDPTNMVANALLGATASYLDNDAANNANAASLAITIRRTADLDITSQVLQRGGPTDFVSLDGEPLTYTIQVTNHGPDRAVDASTGLQLAYSAATTPEARQFRVVGTPTVMANGVSVGSCASPPDFTGKKINCTINTLDSGATATISIALHPPETDAVADNAGGRQMVDPTPLTAQSLPLAFTLSFDPNGANDSDTTTITNQIRREADFSVLPADTQALAATHPIMPENAVSLDGDPMAYTFKVKNLGPDTGLLGVARVNLNYISTVPAAEQLRQFDAATITVNGVAAGGSCAPNPASHFIDCTIHSLPINGEATVTVRIHPPETDKLFNAVDPLNDFRDSMVGHLVYQGSTATLDRPAIANNDNNTDVTSNIFRVAKLALATTHTTNDPLAGPTVPVALNHNVTYTITATNTGTDAARNVAFTYSLPPNFVPDDAAHPAVLPAGCSEAGAGAVLCDWQPVGTPIALVISGKYDPETNLGDTAQGLREFAPQETGAVWDPDTRQRAQIQAAHKLTNAGVPDIERRADLGLNAVMHPTTSSTDVAGLYMVGALPATADAATRTKNLVRYELTLTNNGPNDAKSIAGGRQVGLRDALQPASSSDFIVTNIAPPAGWTCSALPLAVSDVTCQTADRLNVGNSVTFNVTGYYTDATVKNAAGLALREHLVTRDAAVIDRGTNANDEVRPQLNAVNTWASDTLVTPPVMDPTFSVTYNTVQIPGTTTVTAASTADPNLPVTHRYLMGPVPAQSPLIYTATLLNVQASPTALTCSRFGAAPTPRVAVSPRKVRLFNFTSQSDATTPESFNASQVVCSRQALTTATANVPVSVKFGPIEPKNHAPKVPSADELKSGADSLLLGSQTTGASNKLPGAVTVTTATSILNDLAIRFASDLKDPLQPCDGGTTACGQDALTCAWISDTQISVDGQSHFEGPCSANPNVIFTVGHNISLYVLDSVGKAVIDKRGGLPYSVDLASACTADGVPFFPHARPEVPGNDPNTEAKNECGITRYDLNVGGTSLTTTSTTTEVNAGQSASFNLQLAGTCDVSVPGCVPVQDQLGTYNVQCAVDKPGAGVSCALKNVLGSDVSSLTVTTANPTQTLVAVVSTLAPHVAMATPPPAERGGPMLAALFAFGGLPVIGLLLMPRKPRRNAKAMLGMMMVCLLLSGMVACGGKSSPSVTQTTPGTPAGTYLVTVTATQTADANGVPVTNAQPKSVVLTVIVR